MKTYRTVLKTFFVAALTLLVLGNSSFTDAATSGETKPRTKGECFFPSSMCDEDVYERVSPKAAKVARRSGDDGWGLASMAFPTGLESTSNILIEKKFPKKVLKGQPYHYFIKVTNLTGLTLDNVNVVEKFPDSFQVSSTEPEIYETSGERVAWALGKLDPHAKKIIRVNGVANDTAGVPCCTEANFKVPALCLTTSVVDSGLALTLNAPTEQILCETIPLEYRVKNTGNADLRDVIIASNLPGRVTADGASTLSLQVGDLAAGQEKTVQALVSAGESGDYQFSGSAHGTPVSYVSDGPGFGKITAESDPASTSVIQPGLTLLASSEQEKQYIGRNASFDFEITNPGNAVADSTLLEAALPANALFQSATNGGTYNPSSNSVTWNLGNIASSDSRKVSYTMGASTAGNALTSAKASANCVQATTASASVPFMGISALLLEVVDVHDPLEVGHTTVYEVRVTNQGNAVAKNISLTGGFEDMSYVNGSGHTAVTNKGKDLTFSSFSLAPKEVVSWQVELKAEKVGDQRFNIEMNSDQLTRPVNETESTITY